MDSCRELLKSNGNFTCFQYIFSFLLCGEQQIFIYEVHNHDTRFANNFYLSNTNLTKYQKGAGIKILFNLPTHIVCSQ